MSKCLSEDDIQRCASRQLSPAAHSSVDEHLLVCADCASRVAEARGVASGIAAVSPARSLTAADIHNPTRASLGDEPIHAATGSSGIASAGALVIDPPPSASVSLEEFLTNLSQSGLLSPLDIAVVRKRSSSDAGATDLTSVISWLVREHKLTPYQAQVLAHGKGGILILGNYIILEKLGQGGMGTVFKARHRRMNRLVALKVLPEGLASVPEAIARFQREVQAAATLHHPNIAIAYDADEAAGVHFLVMEYVEGPTLAAYVKATGPLPLAAAVGLAAQAARGLAAAHAAGIVHRDVKPSNLMVNRQRVLKILDLGLAQFHGEQRTSENDSDVTRTGSVMGTVDYMAPEQARDSKSVDHRADIYSLGCTFYFLATGSPPAPPGSAAEKLLWHQTILPAPLGELCAEVSPRLGAFVQRLVAKQPEDRPATMEEVVAELEACAAEFPAGQAELTIGEIALSHDHTRSTMGGTSIQATQRDLAAKLKSSGSSPAPPVGPGAVPAQSATPRSQFVPPPASRQRISWAAIACGLVGLVALVAVLVAPLLRRPPQPAPTPPEIGSVPGSDQDTTDHGLPTTPPKISPHAPYQDLLTCVFHNGGSVIAFAGKGERLSFTSEVALPNEPLEIIALRLSGTGILDAELARLAQAPGLRELSLADTAITDGGLAHLPALAQLTHLDLAETDVTNAGLVHIARLAQLIELNLQKTKITDPGMGRLNGLSKLQRLYLSDTAVSDIGLEPLTMLPALQFVALNGTGLSETGHQALLTARPQLEIAWDGADLERLAALRLLDRGATLRVVDLADRPHDNIRSREGLPPGRVAVKHVDASTAMQFGDDDLKHLASLPAIESLSLVGADLSPEALVNLHGLTTLKSLELGPLRLPPAPLEALRKKLPACQVVVKEPPDAEVARLVLAAKGRVDVTKIGGALLADLAETSKLPTGGFIVRSVNVEKLADVDDALVARLCDLPDLESLFLAGTPITDESVQQLAACRSLRELSLSDTQITAAGVGALKRLPALERLYLAGTKIGSDGARRAASCGELTHLSLQGVQLADDDLAPLKRLARLEWLDLSGTPLSDAAAVHLNQLAGLRQLNVVGTALTDAGLEELQASLKNCRVTGDPPDPQRLAARWFATSKGTVTLDSGKLMKIEDLPRDACRVLTIDLQSLKQLAPEEIAARIAACPDVVSLHLSDTRLRAADLACLDKLAALREIYLANLPITDAALAHLAGKAKLEVLDLTGSQVTGAGLSSLARSSELKVLKLSNAHINDEYFAALAAFPKLERFSAAASFGVRDAGLKHIEKLKALKSLDLHGTMVGDDGLARLAPLTALEELDLGGTKVTSNGVRKLAGLKKLWWINLGGTGVDQDVTDTLVGLTELKHIDLRGTDVPLESIRRLQTAFPRCTIVPPTQRPRDPNTPSAPQ